MKFGDVDLAVLHRSLKAAAWERAKGELRAMVAIEGAAPADTGTWQEMGERVEGFVRQIEREFEI